jgi:site-specific DNA-methyltransferase (adenine-specific)
MLNRNTKAPILPNRCCTQPILGRVHHSDWLNNGLADKSVKLIIADPPYFEVKGDFDFKWKSFDDYLIDVEKWAKECKRLLADNGTLFWYGHAKKIAYAQIIFDKYFNLENNIAIEFNRQTKKGVENFRCFAPVSERALMYSLETPQTFISIRKYLWDEYTKTGLSMEQVNELIGTTAKGGGGMAYNTLSITRTKWDMPKEYIYTALQKTGFFKKPYEELKTEFETLRRPFNNFKKLFDVMSFDQEAHITGKYDHDTCKPETLTRALILTCSRPNDLVLVPFAGSGTEVAMAIKEGRQAIGFDVEEKYCKMSNDRIKIVLSKPELFA